MVRVKVTDFVLVMILGLTACSKAPATAQVDRPGAASGLAAVSTATATPLINGKPMWSSTKTYSAQDNAQRAFAKNGAGVGAASVDAYVQAAHIFIDNPPAGTQTLKRADGDVLFYDASSNTFAVATKDGAPRTLFKPSTGAAYWQDEVKTGGAIPTARTPPKTASAKAADDAA